MGTSLVLRIHLPHLSVGRAAPGLSVRPTKIGRNQQVIGASDSVLLPGIILPLLR